MVRLTRLKRRRQAKGWTLEQLAERSGISRKSLGYIERGIREPYPRHIAKLAEVLECDAEDLMEPEKL